MHEMLVAVDLLRRGYYVYRSLTPNSPSDLAIVKEDRFLRVEVTTGTRNPGSDKLFVIKKRETYKFDVLAVVEHGGNISYQPPIEET